jgi:hypothetical protein
MSFHIREAGLSRRGNHHIEAHLLVLTDIFMLFIKAPSSCHMRINLKQSILLEMWRSPFPAFSL